MGEQEPKNRPLYTLVGIVFLAIGYGIAYPFGVIGVVLFVQLVPKLLKMDIVKEKERGVVPIADQLEQLGFTLNTTMKNSLVNNGIKYY